MENSVVAPATVTHAEALWRAYNGQPQSDEVHKAALRFVFGDHRGNPAERTTQLMTELSYPDFYKDQPKQLELIKKWKSKFEPHVSLSEQEARAFITEAINCPANVDALFTDHTFSGVTMMEKGQLNDMSTVRPASKLRGWSLNLSTSGMGTYNCIRQNLLAGTGHMVLLSPDAMYDYRRADTMSHWTHHWIYFQADQRLLQWLNWREVGPHIYHIQIPDLDYPVIRSLFESTLDLDATQDTISKALLLSITEQIFIRCSRLANATGSRFVDSRVQKAIDYVGANLEKPLTIEGIAGYVQLSRTQLSTLFKENTGSTLINWREERRIAKASQLLTQSSLKIQQIAAQVGYEDPLYFSRTFSKLAGMSPRLYRKKHQ